MCKFILFSVTVSILLICGCSTTQIGEEEIVEKSTDNRPKWLFNNPEDKSDRLFFVGRKEKAHKLDLGIEQAKAQATAEIAKKISQRIRTEFVETATGQNINEEAIQEHLDYTVAYVADNVRVSGVKTDSIYWEKIKIQDLGQIKYVYNIFVLSSNPKHEYSKAKKMAGRKLMKSANADAQKVAKEVMDRLNE